ncbi:MAG: chorismate-binding protein [Actinomycetaceae bacterium]|nr:chorismate-binding protein [Arcanobacterium sp.]MDD7505228.1 chorismate-binding protein [Actinomycetaceae bacterium]MDY6143316.1 chorismate-binding protein [Arcanobacterium sp.]
MLKLPQLCAVTRPLPSVPELESLLHLAPESVWLHGSDGFLGAGEAARWQFSAHDHGAVSGSGTARADASGDPPSSEARFLAADRWWAELVRHAVIDDAGGLPECGLTAFGSFSFDPDSPAGSVLIVPEVIVGRSENRAWITIITHADVDSSDTDSVTDMYIGNGTNTDAHAYTNPYACPSTQHYALPYNSLDQLSEPALRLYNGVIDAISHPDSVVAESQLALDASETSAITVRDEPSSQSWARAVAKVRDHITSGDAQKVVLSRQRLLHSDAPIQPNVLLSRLHAGYRNTWVFAVDGLIGATPEMLVSLTGEDHVRTRTVKTRVLAGTIDSAHAHDSAPSIDSADRSTPTSSGDPASLSNHGVSSDHASSDDRASALKNSGKDRREHEFAVQSVLDSLRPLGTTLAGDPFVLELPNVLHLATDITTTLHTGVSILDAVARLHPTAALGGTPRERALELIRHNEPGDRGRFGAPVGWLSSNGASQWCVSLRCAHITGEYEARAYAGAGIVADSIPEQEVRETEAKFVPIMQAFAARSA